MKRPDPASGRASRSIAVQAVDEAVEDRLPFVGSVVGSRLDFLAHAVHQLLADAALPLATLHGSLASLDLRSFTFPARLPSRATTLSCPGWGRSTDPDHVGALPRPSRGPPRYDMESGPCRYIIKPWVSENQPVVARRASATHSKGVGRLGVGVFPLARSCIDVVKW